MADLTASVVTSIPDVPASGVDVVDVVSAVTCWEVSLAAARMDETDEVEEEVWLICWAVSKRH